MYGKTFIVLSVTVQCVCVHVHYLFVCILLWERIGISVVIEAVKTFEL